MYPPWKDGQKIKRTLNGLGQIRGFQLVSVAAYAWNQAGNALVLGQGTVWKLFPREFQVLRVRRKWHDTSSPLCWIEELRNSRKNFPQGLVILSSGGNLMRSWLEMTSSQGCKIHTLVKNALINPREIWSTIHRARFEARSHYQDSTWCQLGNALCFGSRRSSGGTGSFVSQV